MVNLHSLLLLVGVFTAPIAGFILGRDFGGWGFGVFFALLALPMAVALVETPYWISGRLDRRRITLASSDDLRALLQDDFRHHGHLNILRELQRRGEGIEFEMPRLLQFLRSPSVVDRAVGRTGLREFFPVVGNRLADYDPFREDAPDSPIVAKLLREARSNE